MLLRSLLLLAAMLLVVAALASVVAPRDEGGRSAPLTTTAPAAAVAPPPARPVRAEMPHSSVVRVEVGQVVQLTVASPGRDVADVPDMGVDAPVEPGRPVLLTFVADHAGRFPVVLRYSGLRVGTLAVREPGSA